MVSQLCSHLLDPTNFLTPIPKSPKSQKIRVSVSMSSNPTKGLPYSSRLPTQIWGIYAPHLIGPKKKLKFVCSQITLFVIWGPRLRTTNFLSRPAYPTPLQPPYQTPDPSTPQTLHLSHGALPKAGQSPASNSLTTKPSPKAPRNPF